ncbi:adenylate cyclase [Xaviernesmea oryzae]|uniref:Adenylate cyclase n=1 Tax=Xaviernesmea oryzae TaxID=464029 RepID=A0A1Q9B2X9_9HYPH|nr:DUF3095 domain-containing protein [Xaviernesmea oryzae]OLP62375.1 adenylate cyclase [Xaviernesmea oryzae]SEL98648.1 Protein of unknown function [Xaviernesmea oryzae]
MSSESFFSTLPVFTQFSGVTDAANYHPLPDDWWIATADIVDSTGAIEAGRYKTVNMAGASVISAVLNALDRHDLPFVFGGDGALVAVPPSGHAQASAALSACATWAREELDLILRVAMMPVLAIRAAGQDVRVARFQASDIVSYAMFSGGGAHYAEERMKAGENTLTSAPSGTRPDLSGLSCRWNPIRARHGRIVSIIAVPGVGGDAKAFEQLVAEIIAIAAMLERDGHPIAPEGPPLGLSAEGVAAEVKARPSDEPAWRRRLRVTGEYLLSSTLVRLDRNLGRFNARRYRRDVGDNSDFRKFDDGLKMTIDIDAARLERIETRLRQAQADGTCRYGLHAQDEALITCFVPTPLQRDHMHFIDGAAGGYARAASRLKDSVSTFPGAA